MPQPTDRDRQLEVLSRLDRFSRLTDSAVRIPFTRIRFGIEPLLGLIPVVGDVAGLAASLYVLTEAQRAGAPGRVKLHMVKNIAIDFAGGLIPVVGDAFDFLYKANMRNTQLLREFLEQQLEIKPQRHFPWRQLVIMIAMLSVVTAVLVIALGV